MNKALEVYAKVVHQFLFLHLVPELYNESVLLLTLLGTHSATQHAELPNIKLLLIAAALVFLEIRIHSRHAKDELTLRPANSERAAQPRLQESYPRVKHKPPLVRLNLAAEVGARYLVLAVSIRKGPVRLCFVYVAVWQGSEVVPYSQGVLLFALCDLTNPRRAR